MFAMHLGFLHADGWTTTSSRLRENEAAWAATFTPPFEATGNDGSRMAGSLRPGQILIVVAVYAPRRGQPAAAYARGIGVRCLPLRLDKATFEPGWEGQPRRNIPEYQLEAWVNHQLLDAKVFFPTQHPSGSALDRAQRELDRLSIPRHAYRAPPTPGVPEPPLT